MIKMYPTVIEAVDESGDLVFKLESFDEVSAKIELNSLLGSGNLEEILSAIRSGVEMLKLEKPEATTQDSQPVPLCDVLGAVFPNQMNGRT